MDLQLKGILVNIRMSEETYNYSANVYLDGRKIGSVGNDGHGGCDDVYWIDRDVGEKVENHFKSKPSYVVRLRDCDKELEMKTDFELWCGGQIDLHMTLKDVKRRLAKKVVIAHEGKIYTYAFDPAKLDAKHSSGKTNREVAVADLAGAEVLNGKSDCDLIRAIVVHKICDPLAI